MTNKREARGKLDDCCREQKLKINDVGGLERKKSRSHLRLSNAQVVTLFLLLSQLKCGRKNVFSIDDGFRVTFGMTIDYVIYGDIKKFYAFPVARKLNGFSLKQWAHGFMRYSMHCFHCIAFSFVESFINRKNLLVFFRLKFSWETKKVKSGIGLQESR